MNRIIQNAVWVIEDDIYLISQHHINLVNYTTKSGKRITIGGGLECRLRMGTADIKEYMILSNDSFEFIIEKFLWPNALSVYRPVQSFEKDYLQSILDNTPNLLPLWARVIEYWINKK